MPIRRSGDLEGASSMWSALECSAEQCGGGAAHMTGNEELAKGLPHRQRSTGQSGGSVCW
uniref:Uncharacterized protein n=1 Tax=Anguilla anguilla TaxID=7936 RepID=A0A0E9PBZ0_ANGAN